MIYFIEPTDWWHWFKEYYNNLNRWFLELWEDTSLVSINNLKDIKKTDCLILLDYRHIQDERVDKLNVLKVTHQHSTACIPSYLQNDFEQEKWYTARKDYLTVSNTDFVVREMNKRLPSINEITKTWFPMDFSKYSDINIQKDEKLIVMAGRLANDKQYILWLTFLKDLVKEWYRCIFSAPDTEWNKKSYRDNHLSLFEDHWVEIQFNDQENFYKLLAETKYFVSTSLPETLWLSIVEAIIYKCNICVPFWDNSYPELVNRWYDPYSYKSLLKMIKEDIKVIPNITWLNYKIVAFNYLNAINRCITRL